MRLILKDYLVEQYRADHVPLFHEIKKIADSINVICCSISGSGPSVFSMLNSYDKAEELKLICDKIYSKNKIKFNSYITELNTGGVRII